MFQQPVFGVNLAERQDQADDFFFSLVKSVSALKYREVSFC